MTEPKLGDPTYIWIHLSPNDAEVLIGAVANHVPADKMHELILVGLYARIQRKLEEFLRR